MPSQAGQCGRIFSQFLRMGIQASVVVTLRVRIRHAERCSHAFDVRVTRTPSLIPDACLVLHKGVVGEHLDILRSILHFVPLSQQTFYECDFPV